MVLTIVAGLAQTDPAYAVASPPGADHAGHRSYRIVDLGTLGGGSASQATAINASGQVVGWSQDAAGRFTPVLWSRGRMTDLGHLGGQQGAATGISNRGVVVGYSDTVDGRPHAFSWSRGRMRDLGSLGGDWSMAFGVNDLGQVVGVSTTADGLTHPFLWWKGRMTDLSRRGLTGDVTVSDINNRGQVVGRRQVSEGVWHAFRWERGRVFDLGPAGSPDSAALAVNDRGTAVGWSVPPLSADPITHATVWSRRGAVDLGTMGGLNSEAHGVNNRGQIVGTSSLAGAPARPFIWDRGVFTALDVLPVMATGAPRAAAINDAGMIAGYCDSASGSTHAVLWLPARA